MSKPKPHNAAFTLEKADKAIDVLLDGKGAAAAAAAVGVSRQTLYNWQDQNARFAERWKDAQESITDQIEATAIEKALAGDSGLLQFLLKSRRRNPYQERHELTGEGGSPLTILISEREDGPK